ncbi:nucleoporin nsp1 [Purpureocillium lavendulum]|uniref:Nucleoporin nsp1 n=1 Tax=Purpureocillium lavendulum TaxID=1247861 RepID=A0AB34FPB0_9HYPO|nr:nucleoporin nsp1 [Purpureocillium lavendulum]
MVTFALPGDDHVTNGASGTPKARPPLPFAKRNFTASPFSGSSAKRNGTPHSSSSRKLLITRDEVPSSGLNNSSIAAARNIFRSSTFSDSPPATLFSPKLPQSTMKRVFAPGATPEPSRVYRESTVKATPRGMASKATDKELFPMRISSPPPELTGEALTQKVPKDWNAKGSIYADQFLAHLCPANFDDEQRRQFFCVLDLRRLKYAANEIFSKKDWKLNVINFAKEFEKSRSIILLRYGLYEFQNVKPSKEVLKKWRREHGLPEPEEEEVEPTPSKLASKKRKADNDLSKQSDVAEESTAKGKRRAIVRDEEEEPVAVTPAPSKGKRKASVSEEQPAKLQKATPSSAKSLFEKIANKPATPAPAPESVANAKPNPFTANKPASNNLARSVFTNLKPPAQAASSGGNIFGYLSDASSAKNSGVEADAESESETGSDEGESPEAGQSDEPSVAASGVGETGSQAGSNLFGKKAAPTSGFAMGASSDAGTRESTPGRSLFERISKDSDGQPLRADERAEPASAPVDQTWNPSTTPIKFAPATQKTSLFSGTSAPASSSIFAPKGTATSNMFGASKQDTPSTKESSVGLSADEGGKDGGESDKENESQPAKKAMFEPKAPTPGAQPNFGSSLFQQKPTTGDASKEAEAPKQAPGLFSATPKADSQAQTPVTGNLFGTLNKPAEANAAASATQSTTLFGAKPADSEKPAEPAEAPKSTPLFGGQSAASPFGGSGAAGSLFGAKPATTPGSGPGSGASTPSAPLFGSASATFGGISTAPAKTDSAPAAPAPAAQPTFAFGSSAEKPAAGASDTAPKPLFGGTKSPPAATSANGMFDGSPMKQDEPSPAKKSFTGGSNTGSSTPTFNFGVGQPTSSAPSANAFGATSAPAANTASGPVNLFGGAGSASNAASGNFNFAFGATSSGTSFNNPFAGNSNTGAGTPGGTSFTFGAASSGPASGTSSPFQFGAAAPTSTTPAASGGSLFGASQPANSAAPVFGATSSSGSGPSFNFSGAPSQPQGTGLSFGSNQAAPVFAGLQAPAGGSSTTGTNSPLNLGGGSSLATTPAAGTPEPSNQADGANGSNNEEGEKHEQINLTDGVDEGEEVLHEVRAKAMKYMPPAEKSDSDDKGKSKSPWSTQGVGPLRLLKHKESGVVRLLLRAEPRGHIALNRALVNRPYKAEEKYVKITTSNEKADGLETWMIQVKTKDLAKELAEVLEKHKEANKT